MCNVEYGRRRLKYEREEKIESQPQAKDVSMDIASLILCFKGTILHPERRIKQQGAAVVLYFVRSGRVSHGDDLNQ